MKTKKLEKVSGKTAKKLFARAAFSQFVKTRSVGVHHESSTMQLWSCCGQLFSSIANMHKHAATCHAADIENMVERLKNSLGDDKFQRVGLVANKPEINLSDKLSNYQCCCTKKKLVLLFYLYDKINEDLEQLKVWQEMIGRKLNLTGKIRLSSEGINGTLEGCECATVAYKSILCRCRPFCKITEEDFKSSPGTGCCFTDFTVTICQELCTLGVSDVELTSCDQGVYLSPDEFHRALTVMLAESSEERQDAPLLLDVRNFYESKIGCFDGAVKPDLRKFSYFPEYIDSNKEMFRGRKVLTYCTGGIRCERASAYIKQATECSEVYQLQGGIHKYLEKYPKGFFRGKLFVFDNRYCIGSPDSAVISQCFYCDTPHDDYRLCSTPDCRQLVLICGRCRAKGRTTCCAECARDSERVSDVKQCACTRQRTRVGGKRDGRDVASSQ